MYEYYTIGEEINNQPTPANTNASMALHPEYQRLGEDHKELQEKIPRDLRGEREQINSRLDQ